jgi:AcrR family transcriptional regulator
VTGRPRGRTSNSGSTKAAPRLRTRGASVKPTPTELTLRGQQTRDKLIAAAGAIFERDGFLEARITDIADHAAVAHGTFYTYFESKDAIFRAVAEQMISKITPVERDIGTTHPLTLISEANRQYWETFRTNRGLFEALDQVASFSPDGREMRREFRHTYEQVAYDRITTWQKAGIASNDVDPHLAAMALTAMVGRFIQVCLALEDERDSQIPEDQALKLLDTLYARALGIDTGLSR